MASRNQQNTKAALLPVSVYLRLHVEALCPPEIATASSRKKQEALLSEWGDRFSSLLTMSFNDDQWSYIDVSAKRHGKDRLVCAVSLARLGEVECGSEKATTIRGAKPLAKQRTKPKAAALLEVVKQAVEEVRKSYLFQLSPSKIELEGVVCRDFIFEQQHDFSVFLKVDNGKLKEILNRGSGLGDVHDALERMGIELINCCELEEYGLQINSFYSRDIGIRRNGKYRFEGSLTSQFVCAEHDVFSQGVSLSASVVDDPVDGYGESCDADAEYVKSTLKKVFGSDLLSYAVRDYEELIDIDVIYSASAYDLTRVSSKLKIF